MFADCEIVVPTAALSVALMAGTPGSHLGSPLVVELSPSPTGLRVKASAVDAIIPAEGTWSRGVEVDAETFRNIVERIGSIATVSLIYAAGRLTINRTSIDAREFLIPLASYKSPRPGQQPQLIDTPQDLCALANRPLKPRRGQRSVTSLPLFK